MAKLWRIAAKGVHSSGALLVTTHHYVERTEVLEDAAGASDVADHVWTAWGPHYLGLLSPDFTVQSLDVAEEVRSWAPFNEIGDAGSHTVNQAGQLRSGGRELPRELTGKIKVHTNAATRSGHGWRLLPGSAYEVDLAAENWATANDYYIQLSAFATVLAADVSWGTLPTHTLEPIIYSRTRRKRDDANYYFDVTACAAVPRVGWLRRRSTVP